jgi:hypothetical protein
MTTTRSFLLRAVLAIAATVACTGLVRAQDDAALLNDLTTPKTDEVSASFKATRIVNGHSIEQMKEGQLDVRIHHRFGQVNSGPSALWGLDQSSILLSFEYGVTDWLMLGVGRSSYQKTFNGFTKFRLWRQASGEHSMPVSISALAEADCYSTPWPDPGAQNYFSSRLAYVAQVFVARKFSDALSLQLSPTMVHKNLVPSGVDVNDVFAVGIGGRYKFTTRMSFNAEYFFEIKPTVDGQTASVNALSLGVDIETGGHVFQIVLTNALPMFERGFITESTGTWGDGGIHLGFNISRVFTLY